jgi:hypothetical protein
MATKLPRGVRLCNPGNIDYSRANEWRGLASPPSDGRFCRFKTAFWGLRALAKTLLTYQRKHGLTTTREIVDRWAPPHENDTGAYVNSVASKIKRGPDEAIDLGEMKLLASFMRAIVWHENGQQPYTVREIEDAALAALTP